MKEPNFFKNWGTPILKLKKKLTTYIILFFGFDNLYNIRFALTKREYIYDIMTLM